MPFTFRSCSIADVVLIEPRVFRDQRGFFLEGYKSSEFAANGIRETFVQMNQSRSSRGTLRGMHFQIAPKAQGKLIQVLAGEIFDVAVDIRPGSPTFGKFCAAELSSEERTMLYIPAGFAHGFCVTSDSADVLYLTTEEYAPELERGIAWDDPDLAIAWPARDPILSERDRRWPRLRDAAL